MAKKLYGGTEIKPLETMMNRFVMDYSVDITLPFPDIVELARLYILTDCAGSFERLAEWGLIRPNVEAE